MGTFSGKSVDFETLGAILFWQVLPKTNCTCLFDVLHKEFLKWNPHYIRNLRVLFWLFLIWAGKTTHIFPAVDIQKTIWLKTKVDLSQDSYRQQKIVIFLYVIKIQITGSAIQIDWLLKKCKIRSMVIWPLRGLMWKNTIEIWYLNENELIWDILASNNLELTSLNRLRASKIGQASLKSICRLY